MSDLEQKFELEFRELYPIWSRECGLRPGRIPQMLGRHGGVGTAKRLIAKDGSNGLDILSKSGRLDLSIEALVLKDEYKELFTEQERKICEEHLGQYGYFAKG